MPKRTQPVLLRTGSELHVLRREPLNNDDDDARTATLTRRALARRKK